MVREQIKNFAKWPLSHLGALCAKMTRGDARSVTPQSMIFKLFFLIIEDTLHTYSISFLMVGTL